MSRARGAPSARRIPNSGARVIPRASSRPAALKHAMSRTRPTSANSKATKRVHDRSADDRQRAGRLDSDAMAAIVIRKLALEVPPDPRHVGTRLLDRDARLQAPDPHQPLAPAQRDKTEIVAVRVRR